MRRFSPGEERARRAEVLEVLRSYTGPLTKRGLPKRKPLNDHAGFPIEGWEKRECWPEVIMK